MDIGWIIAEERIKKAMENGEFDNLPGKGKPLPKDELDSVPQELRMSYKILKNAGVLPQEMSIQKEMATLESLIAECEDGELKEKYKKELSEKNLHFQTLMEKRKLTSTGSYRNYRNQIRRKLGL
jgi:hypothetical protein